MLRVLRQHTGAGASNANLTSSMMKKIMRDSKQFDKMLAAMETTAARRQAQPLPPLDPALFRAFGLDDFLMPFHDDAGQTDGAVSAVIVPLHPPPKLLQ